MLHTRLAAWFRAADLPIEPEAGRQAYHSDIREVAPDAWRRGSPAARGSDVERAMWLAGISSHDFAQAIDIELTPHLVTPVDDIVDLCQRRARACELRAGELASSLPPPNPHGRPPLPCHRARARQAQALYRAVQAWDALARALITNRWD